MPDSIRTLESSHRCILYGWMDGEIVIYQKKKDVVGNSQSDIIQLYFVWKDGSIFMQSAPVHT